MESGNDRCGSPPPMKPTRVGISRVNGSITKIMLPFFFGKLMLPIQNRYMFKYIKNFHYNMKVYMHSKQDKLK